MKKFLVSLLVFIIMIISILIQINLLNVVTFAGVAANIGIVIVATIGLMCDKTAGAVLGSIYGLLIDIIAGKALGFYLLLYMLLGYIIGKIGKGFSKENKTTLIVIVAISTIVFEIATFLLGMIIYKYDFDMITLIQFALKESIYNIIISLILFKPLTFLAEILNKSKDSYYLL